MSDWTDLHLFQTTLRCMPMIPRENTDTPIYEPWPAVFLNDAKNRSITNVAANSVFWRLPIIRLSKQCCGTENIYSGSDLGLVSVPDSNPDPDPDHVMVSHSFSNKFLYTNLAFLVRSSIAQKLVLRIRILIRIRTIHMFWASPIQIL